MHPYAPRQIRFHGLRIVGGWRLKLYSVRYEPDEISWEAFAPGLALAESALTDLPVTPERPGVGFLIAHRGRVGNYAVLAWWDRENELPLRIFVSPDGRPESWRPGTASESVCVWDLEILWHERQAYVTTVLAPTGPDIAGYLERVSAASSP
jgi:hypothetical protein